MGWYELLKDIFAAIISYKLAPDEEEILIKAYQAKFEPMEIRVIDTDDSGEFLHIGNEFFRFPEDIGKQRAYVEALFKLGDRGYVRKSGNQPYCLTREGIERAKELIKK